MHISCLNDWKKRRMGSVTVLRNVAGLAVVAGAAASVAVMLQAGRRQQSRILLLLFAIWVLSPFVAALTVTSFSNRWVGGTHSTIDVLMVTLALVSPAAYGAVANGYINAKAGFAFLMVPLAS